MQLTNSGLQVQAGGIYVTQAARRLIRAKLADSLFLAHLDTKVSEFDIKTKCNFEDSSKVSTIKFGLDRDNDRAASIARWRLTLTGCASRAYLYRVMSNVFLNI